MGSEINLDELAEAAVDAAARAHVPYSGFHVGAAVISADGEVTTGANFESASYGLTCCAERVTIFAHITQGRGPIVALAVVCPDGDPAGDPNSVMPCGACRQVISEHLDADAIVRVVGVGDITVADLLPTPFRLA